MKYFEGMLMVLGWLVLGFLTYMALHALFMKIDKKIQQKRKLKTLEGKIDKINELILEIQFEGEGVTAYAYDDYFLCKYTELKNIEGVELYNKKAKQED